LACAPNLENYAGRMLRNLFFCLVHAATGTSEGLCSLMIFVTPEEPVNRSQFLMISSKGIRTSLVHISHLWSARFESLPQTGQPNVLWFKTVPHIYWPVLEKQVLHVLWTLARTMGCTCSLFECRQ
jgi:hypothetical protein